MFLTFLEYFLTSLFKSKKFPIDDPYENILINERQFVRIFAPKNIVDENTWHRDKEDRLIEIVESDNWQIQIEDNLPFILRPSDVVFIPKNKWHRILKGKDELVVIVKLL